MTLINEKTCGVCGRPATTWFRPIVETEGGEMNWQEYAALRVRFRCGEHATDWGEPTYPTAPPRPPSTSPVC